MLKRSGTKSRVPMLNLVTAPFRVHKVVKMSMPSI
jgi:hypothetical protein